MSNLSYYKSASYNIYGKLIPNHIIDCEDCLLLVPSIKDRLAIKANDIKIITCIFRSSKPDERSNLLSLFLALFCSLSDDERINMESALLKEAYTHLGYDMSEYAIDDIIGKPMDIIRDKPMSIHAVLKQCIYSRNDIISNVFTHRQCNNVPTGKYFSYTDPLPKERQLVEFFGQLSCCIELGLEKEADIIFGMFMDHEESHYDRFHCDDEFHSYRDDRILIDIHEVDLRYLSDKVTDMFNVFLMRYDRQKNELL